MSESVSCYSNVAWSESGQIATREINRFNESCPCEGEIRSVVFVHPVQDLMARKMWLLYQSGLSLANGFPEPFEEVENAAVVEVEILDSDIISNKPDHWDSVASWAQVRCLKIVALRDIPREFAPAKPLHWPREEKTGQRSATETLIFIWLINEMTVEWLLLTNEPAPRLIMTCNSLGSEPFEICNCPFDFRKWPHKIDKPRRRRNSH